MPLTLFLAAMNALAPSPVVLSDATEADMAQIQHIYAHHVLHGLASFEEEPPPLEEMLSRREKVLEHGLPYLVAKENDRVLGYAYATQYRPRRAYRFTVEDSVYMAEGAQRRGIGRLLLQGVIDRCTAAGFRQMIAIIGDGENNAGSVAVHRACGFRLVGSFTDVGFKHDGWRDTALMQRVLGDGAAEPPAE
jgi:L-amino acid N-acyltransferase YncA